MIKEIALSFHEPAIALHLKSNSDRLFCQPHQIFKAITLSFHKPTIATHLKSNSSNCDRLLLSDTLNV